MIDKSLAKGLTREFFKNINKNLKIKFKDLKNLRDKKSKHKIFLISLEKLLSTDWNNFSINHCKWGKPKSLNLGYTVLDIGDYNPLEEFDENVLISKHIVIASNPDQYYDNLSTTFMISHHVIQRLFQRNHLINTKNFSKNFKLIHSEFRYVNFYSFF